MRMKKFHLNLLAYADDLNLISTSAVVIQSLINEFENFAERWRMRFNPLKNSIIYIGKQLHIEQPVWRICNSQVGLSDKALVLGVTLTQP